MHAKFGIKTKRAIVTSSENDPSRFCLVSDAPGQTALPAVGPHQLNFQFARLAMRIRNFQGL
jgi:hypothetical protein